MSYHDHPDKENVSCDDANCEYVVRGRQICLGECEFIFKKVWKVTMDNCKHQGLDGGDHVHPEDIRFEKEILISDLYHILDLSGKLLNKKDPDHDDVRPYEEFLRYAKLECVADKATGEK
jgi:hypothetical protein